MDNFVGNNARNCSITQQRNTVYQNFENIFFTLIIYFVLLLESRKLIIRIVIQFRDSVTIIRILFDEIIKERWRNTTSREFWRRS